MLAANARERGGGDAPWRARRSRRRGRRGARGGRRPLERVLPRRAHRHRDAGAGFPTRRPRSASRVSRRLRRARGVGRCPASPPPSAGRCVALAAAALPLVPVLTGRLLPLLVFQGGVLRLLAGAVARGRDRPPGVRCAACGRDARRRRALFAAAFLFYCAWGARVPGPGRAAGRRAALSRHGPEPAQRRRPGPDRRVRRPGVRALLRRRPRARTRRRTRRPAGCTRCTRRGCPRCCCPPTRWAAIAGRACSQSALAALTAVLLYRLVRDVTRDERIAAAAWALAVFTPPLAFYAVTLYPETLAALADRRVPADGARATPGAGPLAAAAAAGRRPALGPHQVHPARRRRPRVHAAAALPMAGARGRDGGVRGVAGPSLLLLPVAVRQPVVQRRPRPRGRVAAAGAVGRSRGRSSTGSTACSIVAPALALAIPGGLALWRRRTGRCPPRRGRSSSSSCCPAAAYVGWWGGAAPPARYVLPVVGPDAARGGDGRAPRARCAGRAGRDRPVRAGPRRRRAADAPQPAGRREPAAALSFAGHRPQRVAAVLHRGRTAGADARRLAAGRRRDRVALARPRPDRRPRSATRWSPTASATARSIDRGAGHPAPALGVGRADRLGDRAGGAARPRGPGRAAAAALDPRSRRGAQLAPRQPAAGRLPRRRPDPRARRAGGGAHRGLRRGSRPRAGRRRRRSRGRSRCCCPLGGRGVAVSASGVAGRSEVEEIAIVPEAAGAARSDGTPCRGRRRPAPIATAWSRTACA